MITRTIIKETVIVYYCIKGGKQTEQKSITVTGLVSNVIALIKKEEKLSKFDSVVIVEVNETRVKYGMDEATFIENAKVIE